jgi:hypothetical protein
VPATPHPGRLLEAQALGLLHQVARNADGILREGATTDSEHRVTDSHIRYVRTDSFDDAGDVDAHCLLPWAPPPGLQPQESAPQDVVRRVERRGADAHEHAVVDELGLAISSIFSTSGPPYASRTTALSASL